MYRALVVAAACLALIVIVAGAYVRLSDAGLGCPDWPGCYGRATPSHALESIAQAVAAQGGEHGPVSFAKAWKEMGHRYLAGVLGLLIAAIAVLSWTRRAPRKRLGLPIALVVMVGFQAVLGMWTVTLLLKPAIVTAHLVGGLTVMAMLIWLALSQWRFASVQVVPGVRFAALLGLGVVAAQITMGGWVSANYAGLACPDLPLCHGSLVPEMDFSNAFHLVRELGQTPRGELLSLQALTAIHWTHRMFALVVAGVLAWVVWKSAATRGLERPAIAVGVLLAIQLILGISNVLAGLPLMLAVAHSLGAALLLASLVVLNFFAFNGLAPRR